MLIFRYVISIEGQLRAAKGGYFDFMGRFSVYHERAYAGGATALPLRRWAIRRGRPPRRFRQTRTGVVDRERKDRRGYDEDERQAR